MTTTHFDVAVIGGGPGGYVAAIRAAQLGLNVVVVEREHLGGICLNWGCIPTKALLRAAELRHSIDEMKSFGISVGDVTVDVPALVKRSRKVAARLSSGVMHLLKKNKVRVIEATASIGEKLKNNRVSGNFHQPGNRVTGYPDYFPMASQVCHLWFPTLEIMKTCIFEQNLMTPYSPNLEIRSGK